MLYKQNFLYQLLVFQFFFSTTSRYQPMSMFNVKNEIWGFYRDKRYTIPHFHFTVGYCATPGNGEHDT